MIILTFILLISLSSCLLFLQARKNLPGSDHYYHIGIINGIRKNGHKFINKHPNLPYEKHFAYPQFFHWILSFVPKTFWIKYTFVIAITINILSLTIFCYFLRTIYPIVPVEISFHAFFFFSGIAYVLTPFTYSMWNAKNFGISVRGFGLLLGQLFLYFITWYYLYNNSLFLIGLFLISFCIVLSSQFTFQFILLSSVFLFILYEYIIFLFIPVCAILIFIILMPKVSWNFLMGQFGHKFNYYRFIAPKGILKERYSIWRDFIWDFWLCLFQKHDRPLAYIYKNQAVDSITGFLQKNILLSQHY